MRGEQGLRGEQGERGVRGEQGETGANSLRLGWGRWGVSLKGNSIVWVFIGTMAVVVLGGITVRAAERQAVAHGVLDQHILKLNSRLDMQICIQSLQALDLKTMREELVHVAQVGGNVQQVIRLKWCPWMQEEGKD